MTTHWEVEAIWEGKEGEKRVFAHQALFWPGGNGATVTLESSSKGSKTRRTNR